MKQVNLPDNLESPNDRFFTQPIIDHILKIAEPEDINTVPLGTIQEKYQTFYSTILDITNKIVDKGGNGYFWIICNQVVVDMVSLYGKFVHSHLEQIPLGINNIMFIGILEKRWRIYATTTLNPTVLLIGAGFSGKPAHFYSKVNLPNVKDFCK